MFSYYGSTTGTWNNRISQLCKYLVFCDEEGRQSLPAEEGDALAFIGYLSLKVIVGPQSPRHYITSLYRYYEDSGFLSPKVAHGS